MYPSVHWGGGAAVLRLVWEESLYFTPITLYRVVKIECTCMWYTILTTTGKKTCNFSFGVRLPSGSLDYVYSTLSWNGLTKFEDLTRQLLCLEWGFFTNLSIKGNTNSIKLNLKRTFLCFGSQSDCCLLLLVLDLNRDTDSGFSIKISLNNERGVDPTFENYSWDIIYKNICYYESFFIELIRLMLSQINNMCTLFVECYYYD